MRRVRREVRCLAAGAVLTALGVILLALGAVIEVLDLSMAAFASFTVVFAVIELRGKYPYLVFGTTALLSLLLLPSKTPGLVYALFAGYYPIVKAALEKHLPRVAAWVVKIAVFNAGLALSVFLAFRFFVPSSESLFTWQYWLLPVGTLVFVVYDIALTRLITFYLVRLRRRFHFLNEE